MTLDYYQKKFADCLMAIFVCFKKGHNSEISPALEVFFQKFEKEVESVQKELQISQSLFNDFVNSTEYQEKLKTRKTLQNEVEECKKCLSIEHQKMFDELIHENSEHHDLVQELKNNFLKVKQKTTIDLACHIHELQTEKKDALYNKKLSPYFKNILGIKVSPVLLFLSSMAPKNKVKLEKIKILAVVEKEIVEKNKVLEKIEHIEKRIKKIVFKTEQEVDIALAEKMFQIKEKEDKLLAIREYMKQRGELEKSVKNNTKKITYLESREGFFNLLSKSPIVFHDYIQNFSEENKGVFKEFVVSQIRTIKAFQARDTKDIYLKAKKDFQEQKYVHEMTLGSEVVYWFIYSSLLSLQTKSVDDDLTEEFKFFGE